MVQPAKPPALVAAFEQLHLRLKRLAATITGNEEDAEDTLQDAFLKLWSSKRDIASTDEAAALMTTTVAALVSCTTLIKPLLLIYRESYRVLSSTAWVMQ